MRRNIFLWLLIMLCPLSWIAFYFVFVNIDSHLLSWANLFKDDTQPALLKVLRSTRNKTSNLSSTDEIKEKVIKRKVRKVAANKDRKFWKHEHILLKRYSNGFKRDWCRIHKRKLDWENYLRVCAKSTKWGIKHAGWKNKQLRTRAANSFISKWDIRPAGQFSRFFIQSRTSSNHSKTIGGDSWRIHVNGTSSVSTTVFDHDNGLYEVVFLLMEAGLYQIEIHLDYTLCDGFKDPPVDWYKKGTYQGKNQPDGTLTGDKPYLMEPFGNGKCISVKIPQPKYPKKILNAMDKIRKKVFRTKLKNTCDVGCSNLISSGLGRWINGTWKPFGQDLNVKHEPHNGEGMLWIYGDSVSKRFAEFLVNGPYHKICEDMFKQCKVTYSWVYNVKNAENKAENIEGKDYDHERVIGEINKVLDDKRLDEKSVIMLNWGIHFAAAVNFSNYKRLIDDFLANVDIRKRKGQFKGKIIWRTTTAIFRERFPDPHKDVRRFLTFPRIILYNAYAMSAMCRAGVDVIDVYPMTDSFPPGTVSKLDPVHYGRQAMEDVQALLYNKFKPLSRRIKASLMRLSK